MSAFVRAGAKVFVLLAAVVVAALLVPPSPAAAATKQCGEGLRAGQNTSCPLARALLRTIGRDSENIGDGRRVAVRSPVNGRTYRFYLLRADRRSFTCRARGDRNSTLPAAQRSLWPERLSVIVLLSVVVTAQPSP